MNSYKQRQKLAESGRPTPLTSLHHLAEILNAKNEVNSC